MVSRNNVFGGFLDNSWGGEWCHAIRCRRSLCFRQDSFGSRTGAKKGSEGEGAGRSPTPSPLWNFHLASVLLERIFFPENERERLRCRLRNTRVTASIECSFDSNWRRTVGKYISVKIYSHTSSTYVLEMRNRKNSQSFKCV